MLRTQSLMHLRSFWVVVVMLGAALLGVGAVLAQAPATVLQAPPPPPLGTAFSYQGLLKKSGAAVNDPTCAMTFSLWSSPSGGAQYGANQVVSPVTVTNGIFTVLLNDAGQFGPNAFDGTARWLEEAVQCAGDGSPVTLSRQGIDASPYALYALNATTAQTATYALTVNPDAVTKTTLYYPLMRPMTLDLALVDSSLKGFNGGFTDGRYGYFVPYNNGAPDGKLARVDLNNFTSGGMLDLTMVDSRLKGFAKGFTDGRYGYLAPNNNGAPDGVVARIDLQRFTLSGVDTLDLTSVNGGLKGFDGGFTDGRYGYFVPSKNGAPDGKVARVDLNNFTTGGVVMLDLALVDSGLKGFIGGFTDGRYGYFVPSNNGVYDGKVARVDLSNFTTGGVITLDLALVDGGLKGFWGGFTDGRYGYFVPLFNGAPDGKLARVDLSNFTAGGVVTLDLALVDGGLKGFIGGFTDGRYGYFVPYNNGAFDGNVARVDLNNFTAGGVTWSDFSLVDSDLKGFVGGFTDGRYGYFVPNNSNGSGKVARIQLFSASGSP